MTDLTSQRCADVSTDAEETVGATAPQATAWLLIEHPGPWGPRPPAECGFGEHIVEHLATALPRHGIRLQLIRRHTRPRHAPATGPRRFFLAHTSHGAHWLASGTWEHESELLDLPLVAATATTPPAYLEWEREPVVLTCTHGRRDACCAAYGRTVAQTLETTFDGSAWETTHTGGHRFAANVVVLPQGIVLGRLTPAVASDVVGRALRGQLDVRYLRGRTEDGTWEQAAEWWARQRLDIGDGSRPDMQVLEQAADHARVVVTLSGVRHELSLRRRLSGLVRPISCGKVPGEDPGDIVLDALGSVAATATR